MGGSSKNLLRIALVLGRVPPDDVYMTRTKVKTSEENSSSISHVGKLLSNSYVCLEESRPKF